MKRISIKNIYLMLIISIGLVVLGIGSTYAMFIFSSNIDNPISLSSNIIVNEDVFESFDIKLSSKEIKSVKFNITNSNGISNIKYASWYIYDGDSDDISFYIDKSLDNYLDSNGELGSNGGIVAIDVINNTSNNISLTIGISSSKNSVVFPSYMKLVPNSYKPIVTLANYISQLYTNSSKTTVVNNEITYNYATDVSLMNDRLGGSTDSLDGGNIRYYGSSPNNYIYFNCSDYSNQTSDTCELWRIIGVFDGKVKLIRNSIIGLYSWDSSVFSVNTGYGVNEWSQADVMKLLNPGYETEEVGGSLYYNGKSGTCYSGTQDATTTCDFTNSGIKNDTTRNLIKKVTYYTGGWDTSEIYSNQMYEYERGNTFVDSPSDGITREATWDGKVALAYPSDYGYASDFSTCSNTLYAYDDSSCVNWISDIKDSSKPMWLLNPSSGNNLKSWSYMVMAGKSVNNYLIYCNYGVAPVLYLTDNILWNYGNGSKDSPYRLLVN